MKRLSPNMLIVILTVLHGVGLIGMSTSYAGLFQQLTPVNLLITLVVILLGYHELNPMAWVAFLAAYLIGFAVEVVGVNTGIPFGAYWYLDALGMKLAKTPLLIGVNWLILIAGTNAIASGTSLSSLGKALLGALFMVGLDLLIEPVAPEMNMWAWDAELVPIQNYIAWFGIAFCIHWIWNVLPFQRANKVAVGLYIIQVVFFLILNFTLR